MKLDEDKADDINSAFISRARVVESSWIDYNGHMNVMYYTYAFDLAIDEFLESQLKIGPSYVKEFKIGPYALQTQYLYLFELREGESFSTRVLIIDFDKKKLHLMLEMRHAQSNILISTCETILLNVDLVSRKSCEYDSKVFEKIESVALKHLKHKQSEYAGRRIGLKQEK